MKKIVTMLSFFISMTALAQDVPSAKMRAAIQTFSGDYILLKGTHGCGKTLRARFSSRTELGSNMIVLQDTDNTNSSYINDFFDVNDVVSDTKLYQEFEGEEGAFMVLFEKTKGHLFYYESYYDIPDEGTQSIKCQYSKIIK